MRVSIRLTMTAVLVFGIAAPACGSDGGDRSATAQCGSGDPVEGRPLRIATTVAPITNIVANITGGSGAEITGVVPEGTNSHTYEPAPSVAATLEDADIVFVNGLGLEEPTKQLALANLGSGAELCELGTTVLPENEYAYDFSFPEDGGKPNPHLWTNPPMVADYAELIRDTLVARDPANSDVYDTNLEALLTKIDDFDAALRDATDSIPRERRLLLTYHDAYAYFADEYGWTVVGAMQPSSFDEPSPREVADLIVQIREQDVQAVFGSEVFPSPVLEQIAAESGAQYIDDLRDDDLLGEPGHPSHTWLGLMQFDYVTMIEALGGDAAALRALDTGNVSADTATYAQ